VAGPPDDVFALGVTAYRLVTGSYPLDVEPLQDAAGTWHMGDVGPRPPRQLNPRVEPQLSALILRMLLMPPEARGTAGELADALEAAAAQAGPEADQPLLEMDPPRAEARPPEKTDAPVRVAEAAPPKAQEPTGVPTPPERIRPRKRVLAWRPWRALALVGVFLAVWAWRAVRVQPEGASVREQVALGARSPEAGTAGVGDMTPAAPIASVQVPSDAEAIAQDPPPKPFPEQSRPDAKGQ
jgi:eukaryotic-like serine/threonine-protein kinase